MLEKVEGFVEIDGCRVRGGIGQYKGEDATHGESEVEESGLLEERTIGYGMEADEGQVGLASV
jgi:hypothetical protein